MTAVATERPAYRPLRHPGPRNHWSPEAILSALRAWIEETGRPHAQRKWMREHPLWPSSAC